MAYDPERHRALLFGGRRSSTLADVRSDTLFCDEQGWHVLNPAHAPEVEDGASMVFHPSQRRLVLVGGAGVPNGTWAWSWARSDWERLELADAGGPSSTADVKAVPLPRRCAGVFGQR